jgi:trans-aconitate 2-methyltransferase
VNRPQYLFGDGDDAAQRLGLLASLYHESTRTFVKKATGSAHFQLSLDLGCGLGFTTHLIADTLQCDRVIGLDASAAFIESARRNSSRRVSFLQHDVTVVPFPTGRANLIFARFLLTHLHNPAAVVGNWASQLERGGLLLLEETETIRTTHPVLARYLNIVAEMLAAQLNQLYAGQPLGILKIPPGLKQVTNELRPLAVSNSDAARMFSLNMRAWKDNDFIRANYSRYSINDLEQNLTEVFQQGPSSGETRWEMRQIAWSRQ